VDKKLTHWSDWDSSAVFMLEQVSDLAEGRHGLPARLEFARAGHAVAAALHAHQVGHHLAPHCIVVQVHPRPHAARLLFLHHVDKVAREADAVLEIVTKNTK